MCVCVCVCVCSIFGEAVPGLAGACDALDHSTECCFPGSGSASGPCQVCVCVCVCVHACVHACVRVRAWVGVSVRECVLVCV